MVAAEPTVAIVLSWRRRQRRIGCSGAAYGRSGTDNDAMTVANWCGGTDGGDGTMARQRRTAVVTATARERGDEAQIANAATARWRGNAATAATPATFVGRGVGMDTTLFVMDTTFFTQDTTPNVTVRTGRDKLNFDHFST
jgi:hypothetical protein